MYASNGMIFLQKTVSYSCKITSQLAHKSSQADISMTLQPYAQINFVQDMLKWHDTKTKNKCC
jgi:hypothetical protein